MESVDILFGSSIARAEDQDQDGVSELIVGSSLSDFGGEDSGSVFVYSGASGTLLQRIDGTEPDQLLGLEIRNARDLNHDQKADILVSDGLSRVSALSGRNLSPLYVRFGEIDGFGDQVDGLGDLNGDGIGDYMITSPLDGAGSAQVFSGRELFLDAAPNRVSFQEPFDAHIAGSVPGNPTVLFLWTVDDVSTIARLTPVLTLDTFAMTTVPLLGPPAAPGTRVGLLSFALGVDGTVITSNVEIVTTQ